MTDKQKAAYAWAKSHPDYRSVAAGHARELAGLVDELTAERQTAWICIKDRLPDDDQMVLAIVSGKPHQNVTLDSAIELATYYNTDGWVLESWPEWEKPNVTYWMSLPELPKGVD